MNIGDYKPPIKPDLQGHMTEDDMTNLLQLAADFARRGKWFEARTLRRAYDDLRGNPIPPKGMHTN